MRKLYALLFLLCAFIISNAQSGWESILQSNHIAAKKLFQATLNTDSTNKEALQGLIYLAEIEEDFFAYEKYINSLFKHHPEEHFTRIFYKQIHIENDPSIINNPTFSSQGKLNAKYNAISSLREKRKFDEASKQITSLLGDYKWSLIGPFPNRNGSGHIKTTAIETDKFDTSAVYQNGKHDLKWFTPTATDWSTEVYFHDHLNSLYSGNTFYANTFLTSDKDQLVELRLTRSMPIKIWLDDFLVYENNDRINDLWDNEIIQLSLSKGTHRLLLKSSDYDGISGKGYNLFRFHDNNSFSQSDNATFVVRITDSLGNTLPNINTATSGEYKSTKYNPTIQKFENSSYFKQQIELDSSNLFNHYLFCKALQFEGNVLDAEEFFVKKHRANPNVVFYKHLAAKCYARNGKIERAYEVLNDIDHSKTPIFDLLYEKFEELNMEHDEKEWLEKLNELNSITPSNYSIIEKYIKYYDTKGLQDEKEDFIKERMKKYPQHKSNLEYELEKSNKPRKHYTDKEKLKSVKVAQKDLKKTFNKYDYETLIEHYLDKDNTNKAEALYKELLTIQPYMVENYIDFAKFYYQNDKTDEAILLLEKAKEIAIYNDEIYELLGDIYYDKKNNDKALENYTKAKLYTESNYTSSLDKNIEKIVGQKKLKSLFNTRSFEEAMQDDSSWVEQYKDKDAVILLFTRDVAYDESNRIEAFQRLLIKIQTKVGADEWTEANLQYLGNLTNVKVIKPNGSIVRPDIRGTYVVCKNLEPGDILQVEGYSKSNWKSELDNELYLLNYFSFTTPLLYAKIEFAIPEAKHLTYLGHKIDPTPRTFVDSSHYRHYVWEYNHIPEIVQEEAIIDNLDMYAHVMVSTLDNWGKVAEWYQDKTYRLLEPSYETKELLEKIIVPNMTAQQKVDAIYNYITSEIKYSYVSFLQSNFVPKRCGLTCAAGIGDCKDVATLMITLLRQLGIEAYYVLVKTSHMSSGDVAPSLYFDHVIVGYNLNGEMNYLDLTTDYYPNYVLTDIDVNQIALVIKDGEKNTFRLPADNVNPLKNKIEVNVKAQIGTDRSVDLLIDATYPGMAGGLLREQFSKYSEEEKQNYMIENLGNGIYNNLEIDSYTFHNLEDISQPLTANYKAKALGFANYFLNYMTFRVPFETSVEYSSVMSSKTRQNGVDLAKITNIVPTLQTVEIEIPAEYMVAQVPKTIEIKSSYGYYKMTFELSSKGLKVTKYQEFKQQHIKAEDFEAFKAFYLHILDADATLIPLKKR